MKHELCANNVDLREICDFGVNANSAFCAKCDNLIHGSICIMAPIISLKTFGSLKALISATIVKQFA